MKEVLSFFKKKRIILLGLTSLFLKTSSLLANGDASNDQALYQVASIGAPITGPLIEGCMGSVQKACRNRFYCHSNYHHPGFLGPLTTSKPLTIKDQPGVFPAPVMGPASLAFSFNCFSTDASFIPVIVKPDGTLIKGVSLGDHQSSQTLRIPSPAQTGIYNFFVLSNQKEAKSISVTVSTSISTQPHQDKIFTISTFGTEDISSLSAELAYTPLY